MLGRIALATLTAAGSLLLMAPPAQAASSVQLYKTQYDSPGSDDRSNSSLNAEYMALTNRGTSSQSLSGWTLRDASGHVYTFGNVTLAAGKNLYLHTGKGSNTSHDLYWGSGSYIWNNTGDTAYLRTSSGASRDTCSYSPKSGDGGLAYC